MSERPLPTVIGPTENALRSLLSRVLATTMIDGYDEWVALNHTIQTGTADATALAAELEIDVDAAGQTIQQLTIRGLISDLALTPDGEAQLLHARVIVALATATLTEGIDKADQQTTRAVLDTIRHRAQVAVRRR